MASTELIVDDEYCKKLADFFLKHGANLEMDVSVYITVMESLRETGIIGGDAARALDTYIQYAKKIDNMIYIISTEAYKTAHNFVSSIDAADQYLF